MNSTQSEQVRSRFPALKQDQVYLDNAGGSQTLDSVITSITNYLTNNNVQLGASYHVSQRSTSRFGKAFEAGARYVNANQDEVVFGSSTTQLFRNLSYVLNFQPGDEIIVSMIDHEANIAPWVALAKRQELVLKWWKPSGPEDPNLYAGSLYDLLSPRTKLVTCTHTSNILGYVHNIKNITAAAHSVGALVCVDGVAYAPHRPIDVKDLGVDFYAFSWYKVFGPHIAMLYGSWRAQQHLGSLGHFFNPQTSLDNKLGMSGASYELAQAVPEVVNYLSPPGAESRFKEIARHEWEMHSILVKTLQEFQHVKIYGLGDNSPATRLATVSFTVEGWNSKALVLAVEAESNYGIRWGSFYSERLVRDVLGLGPEGVVRVSMVHYNSVEEIQGLCSLLGKLIGQSSAQKV